MAEFAYKDSNRSIKVDPIDAFSNVGVDHYYCPNPKCQAWLRVVREDGKKHMNPFFRAMPTHPHIEGCDYKAYYDEDSNRGKIQNNNRGLHEEDFEIDRLYEKVIIEESDESGDDVERRRTKEKTDNKRERLISSTGKLARYCLSHEIDDNLGEAQIFDFLIDARTVFEHYRKYIDVENGKKVFLIYIPLYKMRYDKDNARIFLDLKAKYRDELEVGYTFELKFNTIELFWDFRNLAYDYRETKSHVAILSKMGKYYGNDDHYICNIVNSKQYWMRIDNSMV